MKTQLCRVVLAVVILLPLFSTTGTAQNKAAEPSAASVPTSGPRAEFLTELKVEQDKFMALAQATPAEKYTWRPAEGVRSIAEVYLHVAAANYNLPKLIGTPVPASIDVKGIEKSTADKAKVIETMSASFDHLRRAVINMPDANLDNQLDWFGGKNTQRGILLFMMRHMAEHLGQSIAYARMNGIVPPWSEEAKGKSKTAGKAK